LPNLCQQLPQIEDIMLIFPGYIEYFAAVGPNKIIDLVPKAQEIWEQAPVNINMQ
jgi:hypothetical protein